MIKKLKINPMIFLLLILLFPIYNIKAYVRIDSNDGYLEPNSYDITNVNTSWTWASGSQYNSTSPWLYSISNFIYLGPAKGSIINVNADFLFGIAYNSNVVDVNTSYLNTPRNTLNSNNLRCGIGDYKTGYYTGSSPIISNFNVSVVESSVSSTRTQVLYRIKFNYKQDIQSVNINSTNFSCWFERNPSDGLFSQILNLDSPYTNFRYYYYTGGNYYFNVSVSDDPNTAILNNISNQNTTIINQNEKTNETLNDINSTLNDVSGPDVSFLENVAGWLPAGPVDSILTLPIVVLNNVSDVFNGTCSPIVLPLPFIESDIELPCGTDFYSGITGLNAFLISLGIVVGGYLLYCYLIYLYNWVDKKVSMVESDREKWGVN